MKTTIKDLKLSSEVYKYCGTGEVEIFRVTMLSENRLDLQSVDRSYDKAHFEMDKSDYTRWTFKSSDVYPSEFYLNKIDVLNKRAEALKIHLENIFNKQQDFLNQIKVATENIKNADLDILNELKK